MDDELTNLINEYPDVSPETIKRIFIRNAASEAYANGELAERSEAMISEIALISTIGDMKSDDEIRDHLANLEKARAWLSCHIQGIRQGQEKKLAPIFKKKHEANELAKRITKSTKDKNVADLVKALLLASGKMNSAADKSEPAVPKLSKQTCDKCKLEVFSLKFHKC